MEQNAPEKLFQYLIGLRSRARGLSMGISVSHSVAALLLAAIIGAVCFSLRLSFEVSVASMILVGVGLICWSIWWGAKQWDKGASLQQHADAAEQEEPQFRGRLFLALDSAAPKTFLRSRALQKAEQLSQGLPKEKLYPAAPLKKSIWRLSLALAVGLIAQLTFPIGPMEALAALKGKQSMQQEMAELTEITEEQTAVIGDITVEYVFPEYTKMTPVTVPNSDGSIHAPAGTMITVTARSLGSYQSASLQINKEKIIPVELEFGRNLLATFTLSEQGTYRFLLFDGTKQVPSPEYELVFDDDDPPIVTAELKRNVVASNRSIGLSWSAIDDFGVERVVLEIEQDGEVRSYPLRKPKQNQLELSERLRRSPKELGLTGGDKAILRVVAYDNQAPVDQSVDLEEGQPFGKRGQSADLELSILTPEMSAEQMRTLNQKLRDALIPILAAYLLEPTMPSNSSQGMVRWAKKSRQRYEPLRELTQSEWGEQWPTYLSAELIREVFNASGRLIRYTMVTYGEGALGQTKEQDALTFQEMHTEHVAQLERTIFIIDRMLRQVAFTNLSNQAKKLSRQVERLTEQNIEEMNAAEIAAKLWPVDRAMKEVQKESQHLSEGSLKEYIENRSQESSNLQKELGAVIDSGDMEQARQLMEQLSEALQQFSEGLQEQMERMQQEEDDLMEQMEGLIEELEAIEQEQSGLADELSLAREQESQDVQDMADLWQKALELAQDSSGRSTEILNLSGDGKGFRTGSLRQYNQLRVDQDSLTDAVQAKMIEDSLKRLYRAIRRISTIDSINETELRRSRLSTDPASNGLPKIVSESQTIGANNSQLMEILEKIAESRATESIEMQQLAQQLSTEEQRVQEQMRLAQGKVQEVEQQMPTADGSAYEYAQQAVDNMGEAEENLAKGRSMAGEGYQRNASARVLDTIEALQEQMQQMQQMQQQMQQMSEGGGGDQEDAPEATAVDIPAPEDFMTPDEYRRLLLEGMTGDVPEEYQSLKKRYYEELVTQ